MVLPHLECGRLVNQRSPDFGSVLAKSCFGSFRPGQSICILWSKQSWWWWPPPWASAADLAWANLLRHQQPLGQPPFHCCQHQLGQHQLGQLRLVNHLPIVVNINIFIIYIEVLSFDHLHAEKNEVLHLWESCGFQRWSRSSAPSLDLNFPTVTTINYNVADSYQTWGPPGPVWRILGPWPLRPFGAIMGKGPPWPWWWWARPWTCSPGRGEPGVLLGRPGDIC